MRLLLLEHDIVRCQFWAAALKAQGFTLDIFGDFREADEALKQIRYEALLINCHFPDSDAIEWLYRHKIKNQDSRFVLITKPQDIDVRLRAYERGADDCLVDSIDVRELVAKLRALIRRNSNQTSTVLEAGNLRLDTIAREAYVEGAFLVIPRRELSLLEHFMKSMSRTLSREYLETTFYGVTGDACPNSIEVRVSRLRRRLADADADIEIKTIRGIGYRFQLKPQNVEQVGGVSTELGV